MNIFFLDTNPVVAAQYHFDSHVVKMPLEALQILCTVFRQRKPNVQHEALMKATHQNHPCVKWAGMSGANYSWLVEHCEALFKEYTKRYGREHASEARLKSLRGMFAAVATEIGTNTFTSPALAMPEDCIVKGNPVESYKVYYKHKQSVDATKQSENAAIRLRGENVRKHVRRMVWNIGAVPSWAAAWNK